MRRGNFEFFHFLRTEIAEFIPSDKTRLLRCARNDSEGPTRKDGKKNFVIRYYFRCRASNLEFNVRRIHDPY